MFIYFISFFSNLFLHFGMAHHCCYGLFHTNIYTFIHLYSYSLIFCFIAFLAAFLSSTTIHSRCCSLLAVVNDTITTKTKNVLNGIFQAAIMTWQLLQQSTRWFCCFFREGYEYHTTFEIHFHDAGKFTLTPIRQYFEPSKWVERN